MPESQIQGSLFDVTDRAKNEKLMQSVDTLNQKLGRDTVFFSAQRNKKRVWKNKQEQLSPSYTTRWNEIPIAQANEQIIPYSKK